MFGGCVRVTVTSHAEYLRARFSFFFLCLYHHCCLFVQHTMSFHFNTPLNPQVQSSPPEQYQLPNMNSDSVDMCRTSSPAVPISEPCNALLNYNRGGVANYCQGSTDSYLHHRFSTASNCISDRSNMPFELDDNFDLPLPMPMTLTAHDKDTLT